MEHKMKWHVTYEAARAADGPLKVRPQGKGGGLRLFDDKESAAAFLRDCTKKGLVAKLVCEEPLSASRPKYRDHDTIPTK
jgi:hypothetical protein